MTTRGLLKVVEGERKIVLYIHADMYPEGMAKKLYAFSLVYPDFSGKMGGVFFWTASFIFFHKLWAMIFLSLRFKFPFKDVNAPHWAGIGIAEEGIDYMQEYEYTLYLPELTIEVYDIYEGKREKMKLEDFFKKYLSEEERKYIEKRVRALLEIYDLLLTSVEFTS